MEVEEREGEDIPEGEKSLLDTEFDAGRKVPQ